MPRREVINKFSLLGFFPFIGLPDNVLFDLWHQRSRFHPQQIPFSYCLNTSTIMGQDLGIEKEIRNSGERRVMMELKSGSGLLRPI